MWWFLFVVLFIIPLDGFFIAKGDVWLGFALILMQILYLYGIGKEIEGKDCAKIFK